MISFKSVGSRDCGVSLHDDERMALCPFRMSGLTRQSSGGFEKQTCKYDQGYVLCNRQAWTEDLMVECIKHCMSI